MAKIQNFMTKELQESLQCRRDMLQQARVWNAVSAISTYCNANDITYSEFYDIVALIDHYTHHEADLDEYHTKIELRDEEDFDPTEYCVDIDGEDGAWFVIPAIG